MHFSNIAMKWILKQFTDDEVNHLFHHKSLQLQNFKDPAVIYLHGSIGAPVGCINPCDAIEWDMVETKHAIINIVKVDGTFKCEWQPVNDDAEAYVYSLSRWYPFCLNGPKLIGDLLFSIYDSVCNPYLQIQSSSGFPGYCQIWNEPNVVNDIPEKKETDEWIVDMRNMLQDRFELINNKYLDMIINSSDELGKFGVLYEISPFEDNWYFCDGDTKKKKYLAFGFGIDESDLCIASEREDMELIISNMKHFCMCRRIQLYESSNWDLRINYDEANIEILPLLNSVRLT